MSGTPIAKSEIHYNLFINDFCLDGYFKTPDGHLYTIDKFGPYQIIDPRTDIKSIIWGGFATARDRDLAAKDARLQKRFKRTGDRPAELFAPGERDSPLHLNMRHQPGPGFTHIGSFWNSVGRYTILARDLSGKSSLRFGGDVLLYKSGQLLEAQRAAKAATEHPAGPDGAVAHATLAKPKPGKRHTPEA